MRLLLTSGGIKNTSIREALVDLLGKPIAESDALCIPTAAYGSSYGSPAGVWRFVSGRSAQPMCELGWKSLGVLELTALPSIDAERWVQLTPRIGADFVGWRPPAGDDSTLGVVDFSIFPHMDHPDLPENTTAAAGRWAAGLGNAAFAIDDETAVKVVDGAVDVVSEGHWNLY